MSSSFRVRRFNARSFAQISLDRSEEDSIAQTLYDARRLSRVIAPELKGLRLGVDFSHPGNVRRKDGSIVLFVRSAAQKNKLRQLLPRIDDAVHRAGWRENVEIKIQPVNPVPALRSNPLPGKPRMPDPKAAAAMMETVRKMEDSPLKSSLEKLARTLAGNTKP